ncbi:uncharacterized protein G2W53_029615 [Senna tora]|uniref:Uncharacterized protein n=1 Tax=Senna tora TaxID=362788 RepID=A0A834WDV5_9FABA|nr:uncharacterized protein G2W53_029615 [Senna tora]
MAKRARQTEGGKPNKKRKLTSAVGSTTEAEIKASD